MTTQENAALFLRLKALYTAEEAAKWMQSPHPQLGGRSAQDSPYQEVSAIIDRLESGAYL